jgi:uncharacterized protein
METVEIPTAGERHIEGTILIPKTGQRQQHPAALFLHGWGSDREKHILPARRLSELGFVSLTIDLRGHGKTQELEEDVSARDNLHDALAAYDFLAGRNDVDQSRIAVAGFSYGGFLGILLSAERSVRWLILRSPALYRDEDLDIPKAKIKRPGLMGFRKRPLVVTDCAGLRAAAAVRSDVLLVEAENDLVVPEQQIHNYLNAFRRANSLTHRVIAEANHAMAPEHYAMAVDTLIEWLKLHPGD